METNLAKGLFTYEVAEAIALEDFLSGRIDPGVLTLPGRTRMMIAVPVLTLKKLDAPEPSYIAAGVLAERRPRIQSMADTVDEALRVEGENQPDCAPPAEGAQAKIQSAEI